MRKMAPTTQPLIIITVIITSGMGNFNDKEGHKNIILTTWGLVIANFHKWDGVSPSFNQPIEHRDKTFTFLSDIQLFQCYDISKIIIQ